MKFKVYKDKRGEWRWRLVARNGRTIADSAESYKRRAPAYRMAWKIATNRFKVEEH